MVLKSESHLCAPPAPSPGSVRLNRWADYANAMKTSTTFMLYLMLTLMLGCIAPKKSQTAGVPGTSDQVTVSAEHLTRDLMRRALRGEASLVVTSDKGGRAKFDI